MADIEQEIKAPRTQEELNKAYEELCKLVGDRLHKVDLLNNEIQYYRNETLKLDQEAKQLADSKKEEPKKVEVSEIV